MGGAAVGSRPQAVLEVLADNQDEEQGGPKSTESEMLVAPASKRRESVPAASLMLAEGTLVQTETQNSTKKGTLHQEPSSSPPQREEWMAPSSAPN